MEIGAMRSKIVSLLAVTFSLGFAQAASAADMPVKAPAPIAHLYNWAGFYVGVNAGYAWGHTDVNYIPPGAPNGFIPVDVIIYGAGASQQLTDRGFTGGVQAGYNYLFNRVLAGIEADFGYLNRSGNFTGTFVGVWGTQNVNISDKSGWLTSVRGRLGMTFDQILVYGTGGVAFTNAGVNIGNNWNPAIGLRDASASVSNTRAGWVVGGGLEYGIQPNWSIKAEYLRMKFTNDGTTVTTLGMSNAAANVSHQYNVDMTVNIARIGLNYRFGG
jgi:outer membrane immunogenic protein